MNLADQISAIYNNIIHKQQDNITISCSSSGSCSYGSHNNKTSGSCTYPNKKTYKYCTYNGCSISCDGVSKTGSKVDISNVNVIVASWNNDSYGSASASFTLSMT